MPSYIHARDIEPKSGVIARATRFLLRCAAYPVLWTAQTIADNFFASVVVGTSMGLVYLGGRNENRFIRVYYYLIAASLLITHLFIVALTYGTMVPPPEIMK